MAKTFPIQVVKTRGKYGAQNEAYKCLLVDKVVNDLCLS